MQPNVERLCAHCGYDLRATPAGRSCPECGLGHDDLAHEPLAHMPLFMVRRFRNGSWLAVFSLLSIGALAATALGIGRINGVIIGFTLPFLVLWPLSIMLMTPAYPLRAAAMRGFNGRSRLRAVARVSQCAWLIAFVCVLFITRMPALRVPLVLAILAGLIGLGCVAVLMERLSEWVCDTTAERAFNWAIWTMPISLVLSLFSISIGSAGVWIALRPVVGLFIVSSFLALPCGFF
ncbi:MAG: hypothetical protein KC983_05045, partial [Phycisphaerales bacterium]|nr:hypothetical protein [Phycisphaerales bacterium]